MDPSFPPTKYDLFFGKKSEGELLDKKAAGFSLLFDGNRYYVLRLMMFPQTWYYLAKNHDSQTHYTIFSKFLKTEGGPKFQNPVGTAVLGEDLMTHLELKFHALSMSVFMTLFSHLSIALKIKDS